MSSDTPTNAPQSSPATPASAESPGGAKWHSTTTTGLLFGLLGAAVAWLAIEACLPMYTVPPETANMMNVPTRFVKAVEWKRSLTSFAIMGGALGISLAVGEALRRGNRAKEFAFAVGCGVVGAAVGLLAGYVGQSGFDHYQFDSDISEMNRALRIQLPALGIVTAGVGLALGLLLRRNLAGAVTFLLAGLLAGALAAAVFIVGLALVLPGMNSDVLIPGEPLYRLLWVAVIGGLLGVILAGVAQPKKPKQSAA